MPCGWRRKKPAPCKRAMPRRLSSLPPIRWWPAAGASCPRREDDDEVRACLTLLSGRRHQVITAVALMTPDGRCCTKLAMTRVSFLRLANDQIDAYVESREGLGKAGGYAIQGRAEIFVKEISGSYSNVVGLPLALTVSLLTGCGFPIS